MTTLTALVLAGAVAMTPAAPAAEERQRLVTWKSYEAPFDGPLGLGSRPECWRFELNLGMSKHVCVDRETWMRTPLFSHYPGGAA